jgi:Tn3 transposase DDE domain-containing protein
LGALSLVANIIILWKTLYINALLHQIAGKRPFHPAGRRSAVLPLVFEHITLLGRYAFSVPDSVVRGQLRYLRNPTDALEDAA